MGGDSLVMWFGEAPMTFLSFLSSAMSSFADLSADLMWAMPFSESSYIGEI